MQPYLFDNKDIDAIIMYIKALTYGDIITF